jgi:hypothetical protein
MKNKTKRSAVFTLTLLLSLALTLALPVISFAEPEAEATSEEPAEEAANAAAEESVNITMEYRYAEGESVIIPQTITQGGIGYHLLSQADPVAESSLPSTRTYTYKIDGAISPAELEELKKIPNIVLTPVNVEMEREVDKTGVIKGLPNNDVDYLPTSKEFSVTSAKTKNGISKEQLKRAGVTYKITAETDGLPTEYEATIVYRGIETYEDLGYYKADLTYLTDETVGSIPQYVIVAVYEPDGAASAAEEETEPEVVPQETVPDVRDPDAEVAAPADRETEQLDNQTGNPLVDLFNGNVPLGNLSRTDAWSIVSLLLVIIALAWSAVLVIGKITSKNRKIDRYNDILPERKKLSGLMSTFAIVVGVITALLWYLLDDLSLRMVMFNRYTIFIFAVFAVQAAFVILSRTVRKGEHKGEKDELQTAG